MQRRNADKTLALVAGALADGLAGRSIAPAKPAARKVYLTDNSWLRPDAAAERAEGEDDCKCHCLILEWPAAHFLFPCGLSIVDRIEGDVLPDEQAPGRLLHKAWRVIGECDAIVAEVTPFRGPHLNPLIAFEIGVAVVHDIPVFAWTTALNRAPADAPRTLADRIYCGEQVKADGYWRDQDSNLVENFDLVDWAAIAGNFASVSMSRADAIRSCAEYLNAQGA